MGCDDMSTLSGNMKLYHKYQETIILLIEKVYSNYKIKECDT